MRIGGLILGKGTPITDGRTLRGMERCGHFTMPHNDHPYVDEGDNPRRFVWHGQPYRIQYFDGCIYPFVVKG